MNKSTYIYPTINKVLYIPTMNKSTYIYPTINKVDNTFQVNAFNITYMTSINLMYYHFIEFSLLHLLHMIWI